MVPPESAVAADARQLEAFGHDTLTGESRVAVQQHCHDLPPLGIAQLVLLGADLAQDDGVHRLEVGGVRGQRQVDDIAVELAVGRGAEVVFHVARAVDILGLEAAALDIR